MPAMAETTASSDQATMSSMAAHASAMTPSGVRVMPALVEDAGQHRERGDAHRGADEQRESQLLDVPAGRQTALRMVAVERQREKRASDERQQDRRQ